MKYSLFPTSIPGSNGVFSRRPPSEVFVKTIVNGGTTTADCCLCGRVHFNETGEFMEDGELAGLLKKQKRNPSKYIAHDNQVFIGHVDGKQIVADCPCNGLFLYEEMFWRNRHLISEYIVSRTDEGFKKAKDDVSVARAAKEALRKDKK